MDRAEPVIEICSGAGQLADGVRRACPDIRVVVHVEIEAFPDANLVAKMEGCGETRGMAPAATWTDIKTFDGKHLRGQIRGIVAGYPCQPFSYAGKRAGEKDPRHLWPWIKRAINDVQPSWVFLENVAGHVSKGLREVLADLAHLGYRVEGRGGEPTWGLFEAVEAGAPHRRQRVFVLAHRVWEGSQGHAGPSGAEAVARSGLSGDLGVTARQRGNGSRGTGERWRGEPANAGGAGTMAHGGLLPGGPEPARRGAEREGVLYAGRETADHRLGECGQDGGHQWPAWRGEPQYYWEPPRLISNNRGPRRGKIADAIRRRESVAPGLVAGGGGEVRREISHDPRGGGDDGERISHAESGLGGDADGLAVGVELPHRPSSGAPWDERIDRIRLLGNGVVPHQAELAWITLWSRV